MRTPDPSPVRIANDPQLQKEMLYHGWRASGEAEMARQPDLIEKRVGPEAAARQDERIGRTSYTIKKLMIDGYAVAKADSAGVAEKSDFLASEAHFCRWVPIETGYADLEPLQKQAFDAGRQLAREGIRTPQEPALKAITPGGDPGLQGPPARPGGPPSGQNGQARSHDAPAR